MKIIVTGALGHIGSYVLRQLPLNFPGAEIILIDNLTDEYSVANQFSIGEKINWIHQVIGAEIISDVIQQCHHSSTINSEHSTINFHQFDLVSSHHKGLHDKIALGDAICQITRI